jgi:hypothetical protein
MIFNGSVLRDNIVINLRSNCVLVLTNLRSDQLNKVSGFIDDREN